MKKLCFVYFDAGGGHRSAAMALREVVERENRPWEIELLHLQELLDSLDIFRKVTGIRLEDCYNLVLKKGWTLGSAQTLRFMQWIVRWFHDAQVKILAEYWRQHPADLVVSLIPNFNRALAESLGKAAPGTPLVTVLTDLADYPPNFWIVPEGQYYICGTDRAVEQARAAGHGGDAIFRASGMILNPRFYEVPAIDRAAERRGLGLAPDLPTGLVLFGGQGSNVMEDIARRLDHVQLILICGRNEPLAARLRALRRSSPTFVEGFTREVPYYMQLSDFFIGKPGPGSLSEALHMGLPVITERNAWTLPQERYNAEWIREQGYGIVVPHFRQVREAVDEILDPERGALYRGAVAALDNRAVFEIPGFLGRVLDAHSVEGGQAPALS
ncbi:MAG: galactosyldiacylglycerol synthase [Bryobacterales bacterium]|nr:galactosyldiacylglycerol synthase [Bryobacterales bacterium]